MTNLQTEMRPGQQRNTALDQQMRQIETALNYLSAAQIPAVRMVYANYAVQPDDEYLFVDASGGTITISLPSAGAPRKVGVIKVDASGNAVTNLAFGSETIAGAATKVLAAQWDASLFVASGGPYWGIF